MRVDHRLLLFGGSGNSACCKSGSTGAEQRRPEHQAGDQLAHHRRLLEPQHDFAEQAADQHQHHDLRDEQEFGRAFVGFARGPCRARGKHASAASGAKSHKKRCQDLVI